MSTRQGSKGLQPPPIIIWPPSHVFRRNTIILDPLVNQRILSARRRIRHLDLVINHIIHLPIFAHPLCQLTRRNIAHIRLQPRQLLHIAPILVDGCDFVLDVSVYEDVLGDRLARFIGDFPDFVVALDVRHVFGDRGALGDEPSHIEDFGLAVVVIPPAGGFGMFAAIVSAYDLGAIMLSCDPRRHFDALGAWFELAQTFHQGAADNGRPAVGGLHNFDAWIDGGADGFA